MARRGRKRTKTITYQSEETKSLAGLLCLILASLFFLSYFVEAPAFELIGKLFGQITFLAGIFLINLGLYFLCVDWAMAKKSSLFGQIILLFSLAILLHTTFTSKRDALDLAEKGGLGGLVGYTLAWKFFIEYFTRSVTIVLMAVIVLISTLFTLTISIKRFIDHIGKGFKWMSGGLYLKKENTKGIKPDATGNVIQPSEPAKMFGDFGAGKMLSAEENKSENMKLENNPDFVRGEISHEHKKEDGMTQPKVEIKEDKKEGAFVNEELQYPEWKLPPIALLNPPVNKKISQDNIKQNADIIEQTLQSFGVKAQVVDVLIGPTVTQYALNIALGTKVSKIANLKNDLALALATSSNAIRIEAPITGTSYVGIEVPNSERETIVVKQLVESPDFQDGKNNLGVVIGKNVSGKNITTDLQKMPHLLIAGATGSGKSVLTNTFIISLLMTKTPDEVRFIMVDPKQVELSDYNGIPHLLTPVITEMEKVKHSLIWAIAEMEKRYTIFSEAKVRNIEGYNQMMGFAALPYIIIVIDEMADMMLTGGAEVETAIVRLAQKARATGIHLLLATQRPSVDVLTGLIKANIPGRIGMSVATQIDSRVILDQIGAESLLGRGDLLFKEPDKNKPYRVQAVWLSQEEVHRVVKFIKDQVPEVHYTSEVVQKAKDPNAPESADLAMTISDDELFIEAAKIVISSQKGSASLIQRKLSVGYNRAARLLDELEEKGIVGAQRGSKPREVLVKDLDSFVRQFESKPAS
ncbi:DNA translocase FtsK 4TM domain-containing protein [Candidatus Dojkabacteria bacterium]|nr:DNA translocase FtsK 4TM domain-containing protein [Candidatus Dojkabacteria bacterium]